MAALPPGPPTSNKTLKRLQHNIKYKIKRAGYGWLMLIGLGLICTACVEQPADTPVAPSKIANVVTIGPAATTAVGKTTESIGATPPSATSVPPTATSPTASLSPSTSLTSGGSATTPAVAARTGQTSWWRPTPDKPIAWHWQLSDKFNFLTDVIPGVTVYDIDGEYATAETVAKLHALGPAVKVICYFDAGVYESYRSDANRFPKAVIGSPDEGWDNSFWLDIRQTEIIVPIMRDRIQHWCKDKGFDAIEPDETEVWSNKPGFPVTKADNNAFNQKIAELAHSAGLSVGLKGNTSEADELWPYFDWTLNEQCWQYDECEILKTSFIDHGKAVFNIEYNTDPNCALANQWQMNSARRDLNLVGPTNPKYRFQPCVPYTKTNW